MLSVFLYLFVHVAQAGLPHGLKSEILNLADSVGLKSELTYLPLKTDLPQTKFRTDSVAQKAAQPGIPFTNNAAVQSYIDLYSGRKQQVGKMLGLSSYYFPVYEKVLKEFGLPEELKFLSVIESALNPNAVSRVGATGPWQFMFATAKGYGLKINKEVDERKDPVQASKAAAAYLRDAFNQFGDWFLAIASYNAGRGAVSRAIAKAGGKADFWAISRYLPAETRNYVPKFIATAHIMSNYKAYDINLLAPNFNTLTDVFDVVKPVSLAAVARATGIDLQQLLLLNPAYKKMMVKGTPETPMPLVIPASAKPDYTALYQVLNGNAPAALALAKSKNSSAAKSNAISYHVVKKGENLSTIIKKFPGITLAQIKAWNGLRSDALQPGMRLKVSKD